MLGCGPADGRLKVTGEVLLGGAALDTGSIRFTRTDGESPYSSGAMIRDGEFLIPRDKGLLPGVYNLQISSPDTSGPTVDVGGVPIARERIPPKYNVDSVESVEVSAEGSNHFKFDIPAAPIQ